MYFQTSGSSMIYDGRKRSTQLSGEHHGTDHTQQLTEGQHGKSFAKPADGVQCRYYWAPSFGNNHV